jgi:integrase
MGKRAHGEGTITQRKDGTWMGQVSLGYSEDGKRQRKTIYGKTQKEVRAKLDELKQQAASGSLSLPKLTVKEYLMRWLREKERQVKPRTHELYSDWADRLLSPRIGRLQLDKLTPLQVQNAVGDIADKIGVSTANKCRKMLYGALKQAVRWQLVSRNVCEAVDPLKEEPRDMLLWTTDEAVRFLDAIQVHRFYAAFYIAMCTGLRRGEILGLRWSDLRGDSLYIQRSLTVVNKKPTFSTPKTRRGTRFVTLPADAIAVLEQHRQRQGAEAAFLGTAWPDTDQIFTTITGTLVDPRSFNKRFNALQEQASVPHVRLHDLRHLHVSLLVRRGTDLRTIADRVGHADPAFTLRKYAHMFEEQRRAAAVNLRELLSTPTHVN